MESILTTKKFIKQYILAKISSNDWKASEKIPSESSLSVRFKCSRLTVRSVLQNLVFNGILTVNKGKGYYVNPLGTNGLFLPPLVEYGAHHFTTQFIGTNKIHFKDKWIKQLDYKFINLNFKKTQAYQRLYFNEKNEKIIHEFFVLNKEEVFLEENTEIKTNLNSFFIWKGVLISATSSVVIFEDDYEYIKIAKHLGWKKEYPLIITVLTSYENWLEISIKIVDRNIFCFRRNYRMVP